MDRAVDANAQEGGHWLSSWDLAGLKMQEEEHESGRFSACVIPNGSELSGRRLNAKQRSVWVRHALAGSLVAVTTKWECHGGLGGRSGMQIQGHDTDARVD